MGFLNFFLSASSVNRRRREDSIRNNYQGVNPKVVDYDFIEINFDPATKHLDFVIRHYHRQPKITRYVTNNYKRHPIYEEYSERTKILKKFSKIINPYAFVNQQILKIDYLNREFILKIINKIGLIPEWRKKEIKIEKLKAKIILQKQKIRNYQKEKLNYEYRVTDFCEVPSRFWIRMFLSLFTFGLSFIHFISKKRAYRNIELNRSNKVWNTKHTKNIDAKNKKLRDKINLWNGSVSQEVSELNAKLRQSIKTPVILEKVNEEGWVELRRTVHYEHKWLNSKGVYIIWNKTKDRYYVGQSKNLERRIFKDHFKNGEVNNIIFAKDWFNGDIFYYKYFLCDTKDELDSLEKKYINKYFAFENGYNKTRGNT